MTSTQWVEYHVGTKRKSYNALPTSDITAEAVTVDGFTLTQTDNSGVTATHSRSYTANGMIHPRTDGRGNTTTSVTDAAGNVTTTAYDSAHDLPATVTDAQGNTTCYRYDARGRKLVEWGTGIQPVCFGYDDADRMVTLTTFRAGTETVSTDPSDRTDGDTTTWSHHNASGMETAKTYADNTSAVKTYDAYNRVLTETDARGKVKVHTYEQARGLLLGTSYNDSTSPRAYTYNHLAQPTQVTDAAGVRTLSYNTYGEQESDSLVADNVTHLITETRDDKGRSTGYTYAKNGSVQQTVTTGYGSDGRIASAGFLHGGAAKQFSYEYMAGTHLLEKLTMPNNMTLIQSYEIQRDLLTGMAYHRGTTLVANRQYSYDTLGRPTVRNTSRQGTVKNDIFGYNYRSELTTATVNGNNYAYDYDNIGNRETATESDTIIECAYDHMGRRATKKVTVDGSITLHQRYLYRGYLQIACCDLTRSAHPCLWLITWDPTQPIATRPLAIQKDATWFTYGWDLTKNICELYGTNGYIRTAYTYSPYGAVTESGNTWQPIQWSSEHNDVELGLEYYNYRHYNPMDGRWLGRDVVSEIYHINITHNILNTYVFLDNIPMNKYDVKGGYCDVCGPDVTEWLISTMHKNFKQFKKEVLDNILLAAVTPIEFYKRVRTGGAWDLKNSISFESSECKTKSPTCKKGVTLCGQCTLIENIGNIHYGWIGRAIGFPRNILTAVAAAYQNGGVDESHDAAAIIIGMDMFDQNGNLCDYIKQNIESLKAGDSDRDLSKCTPCLHQYR